MCCTFKSETDQSKASRLAIGLLLSGYKGHSKVHAENETHVQWLCNHLYRSNWRVGLLPCLPNNPLSRHDFDPGLLDLDFKHPRNGCMGTSLRMTMVKNSRATPTHQFTLGLFP